MFDICRERGEFVVDEAETYSLFLFLIGDLKCTSSKIGWRTKCGCGAQDG
jgi:hypothetical protein